MSDQWKRLVKKRPLQRETVGLAVIHLGPVVWAPASRSMNDGMWNIPLSVAERNNVIIFGCAWIEPVDIKKTSVCRVKACKESV
jgi:hypothetical protein